MNSSFNPANVDKPNPIYNYTTIIFQFIILQIAFPFFKIVCFILKAETGSSPFTPLSDLTPVLKLPFIILPPPSNRENDDPRAGAAAAAATAAAWARSSDPLLCRWAMSMPPLRPPRPSLADTRSPPARCISTGEPRRYTAREVSLTNNIKSLLDLGPCPPLHSWQVNIQSYVSQCK